MRERILTLFMTIAILFTTITPGLVPSAEAAGGTVTKTYTATADTMQLNGQAEYNGIYDNDGDGYLYVGMSNNDGFVNVRNRMAASFNLGAPEGTIVSAELVVTVATVLRVPNHTLYMEARGSAANSLDHNFNGTFPFVDVNSPFSDKFTAKSTAEVPMGTYLQDQSITFNVKSAVDAFTGGSDRTVTFTLNGNEADADSGRFLLYSLEASNAAFRPKLVVTYETGPTNTPPTGSFKIAEGTATSASTVNLSVTGSDPDAGDSVTHMRFANSVANLSAASWLPFSNTATFSLSGGDGAKNIYMQVRDSNNAISASSSQIILLDQTAPTGALIINDGAAWTKSEMVTLKGTYTDGSGSGVEQVRLSNVNGTWQTSWFSIADLNGRSWVLPAGQGVKNVYVQYKDRVGNSSNSTISSTITVDTIAPVITNVVNNIVYNSKVNPLFYEGSGLLNGSPYTSGTDITQDGTYTLIVTDQAGNSATVVFKVDTIAPTVTGIANGVIYNTIKTITFNKGTATLNGAAFVSGAQVSQDGVYTLIVTDTAGNVTTINFEIDTTAPKIKGVSEGGVYKSVTPSFNEGTAQLNGTAYMSGTRIDQDGVYTLVVTDTVGNVTTVNFEIENVAPIVTGVMEGGIYISVVPSFNEGTAQLNGTAYTSGTKIDQDGVYTLVVTDAAGNVTMVKFIIDRTVPTVTGVVYGVSYNTDRTITFNEGTATLNGDPFASGETVSAEGDYTLIVTDAVGNVTTVSFTIHKTGPTVTGVVYGSSYNTDRMITFNTGIATLNGDSFASGSEVSAEGDYTLIVTDAMGNVTTIAFTIDKTVPIISGVTDGSIYNTNQSITFNEGTATLNGDPFASGATIFAEGDYTLVVTDEAGNVTTANFIIDRTAPTVTGVVYGVSYNTDRTITFNEGTATLNGDPFASGETVSAEGNYTLIVTDAVGNVTTVSFTIHKTGPTVTGVVYGSSYNTDRMITFNTGIATLNGDPFASGSEVSAEGDYTLIVTDAMGNVTTIAFTIDKTVPIISGVTDGSIYNTNQSITFNEGTATLNGDPFASGATVFAEGDYTLVVTDEAGNVTMISFTIDRTNPIITGLTVGISNYTSPLTIGFNEGTATLNGQPFTTGTRVISSGNYTLVVIDEAGNQTIATFTLNISTPESGSGSSSDPSTSSSTSPIPSLGLEIEINGVKQKDLAKETTAVMNGKKVTTVTIDEKKLSRYLDSLPDKPVINIPVHNDSDRVLLLLNGQLITTLNDRNAVILIQTELGSYLLAANRIDWSLVTKRFGSEDALRNMVIQVEITNVPESDIVQLANSIGKARLLSPPIDFNITAAHGGKTIELNKFLSYVERTIVIPNSADDHNKNITGITMTKDGNIVPVPTRMMRENGKTFAVIYSLTNSVYAVIENDKTFADIQNHWAKYDIEQVASKLIVQGVTESSFQPNKQITRAEFTAMLVRALGLHTVDQPTSFTDVNSGQWYYETVSIAEGYGLVTASNNSQYTPNEKLSREEAMVLLGKAMKLAGMDTAISDSEAAQQLSTFKDHHLLDLSARAAAALNVKYGIIIGNQGQLTPNNVITRAEATVILQRLLEAAKLSS
ncbi:S-layer homology domain-containing protein [Paenibacillus odorifer]|uniref:S-layer homology domain-containing protein n=1 Tax=Paenibacillus odorifer TaxID=189426 RepID=UPI00158EDD6B|nr:S-layer homology domain-containing protein [Paenibacillus odorifer]